jgi:hypothetical protein
VSVVIERQHAIGTAIEVYERAGRVEGQTAGIDDPLVGAEWSDQCTIGIEAEDRAVATAVAGPALVTRSHATLASTAPEESPTSRTSPDLSGTEYLADECARDAAPVHESYVDKREYAIDRCWRRTARQARRR